MQTEATPHHLRIRDQFAQRVETYEKAAGWMLSAELIEAQRNAAGHAVTSENRCLDLCCGTGIVGRNLLDLGWKVTGLDLTPEMAEAASRYYPTEVGSVEELPFADASFDLAILRQSFMLVDAERTLAEIRRVLTDDSRFILIQSVSFSDEDDERYEEVQRARHINILRYDRASDLERHVTRAGFEITGRETLRLRESVDHWLGSAPELGPALRERIYDLIHNAPESYKRARNVKIENGTLFEDWNWLVLTARVIR